MNSLRIYIDDELDSERLMTLKRILKTVPFVLDVEHSEKELHEVVVDYEAQKNLPVQLIRALRDNGYHPDILSA